jgi:hypothetical protein
MKNILRTIYVMVFTCVFSSCTTVEQQPLDYEQIADQITAKTGKQLKKEKGLILVGTGGRMMNDIQMMAMSFFLYHEVSLEEARELVVYAAEKYLNNINANKKITPFLHDTPFTKKNIEINLFIYKPDRSSLDSDKIYYISMLKGGLSYYAKAPDRTKALIKETYEEALEIVNNEKNSLPKAS